MDPDSHLIDVVTIELLIEADDGAMNLVNEVCSLYFVDGRKRVDAILSAAKQGDVDAAAHGAHALKGASRTIGAVEVGLVCERIEQAGELPGQDALDELEQSFSRACGALRAFTAAR
jgi:HPt (histidine-containing phosphotransfer) domain-containing protein